MLYRIAVMNRWYDDLEHRGSFHRTMRFVLFMAMVGLPLLTATHFVSPWFLLIAATLIAMRMWWLSAGAVAVHSFRSTHRP